LAFTATSPQMRSSSVIIASRRQGASFEGDRGEEEYDAKLASEPGGNGQPEQLGGPGEALFGKAPRALEESAGGAAVGGDAGYSDFERPDQDPGIGQPRVDHRQGMLAAGVRQQGQAGLGHPLEKARVAAVRPIDVLAVGQAFEQDGAAFEAAVQLLSCVRPGGMDRDTRSMNGWARRVQPRGRYQQPLPWEPLPTTWTWRSIFTGARPRRRPSAAGAFRRWRRRRG